MRRFWTWFNFLSHYMQSKRGQQFSNAIEGIDIAFSQLDWYLFPSKVQRMLPTVMLITQQPTFIKCFGNVLLARQQFRKVGSNSPLNTVFPFKLRLENIIIIVVCSFFRWLKRCTRILRCFGNFINRSASLSIC